MPVRGKIYFIGGGPGDPALMTVKGMGLLNGARMVLAPGFFRETFAAHLAGKDVFDPFDFYHGEIVAKVESCLVQGGDAVFLVPGDLAIYSPVQSLIDHFGGSAEVVPGVSTMNAASAVLKRTFDLPGISHSTIVTSPKTIAGSPDTIAGLSRRLTTMVIFMNDRPVGELKAELSAGYPEDTPVAVIYDISLPGQEVTLTTLRDLPGDVDHARFEDEDQFKLIIVGGVLTAGEDPSWWDRRKDMRDKRRAAKAGVKGRK